MYGPIEKLVIVKNKLTGKSRGYAFILFEREKDMKGKLKLSRFLPFPSMRSSRHTTFSPSPSLTFSCIQSFKWILSLYILLYTAMMKREMKIFQLFNHLACPHLSRSAIVNLTAIS
jgi:RNA recognition motif-containing protein